MVEEEVEEGAEEDSQNTSCHKTPALLRGITSIKDAKHYKLIYKVYSLLIGCHQTVAITTLLFSNIYLCNCCLIV